MNQVCIGSEFTTDPATGALTLKNTQPGSWPYAGCSPSSASGLRKDPTLGLWVDPINLAAVHDLSSLVPSTSLTLNAYTSTGIPTLTLSNPSSCLPMQCVLLHNFRCHGLLPLHSYVLEKLWVGRSTDTRPADASITTYDSYHCWTDAQAEFSMTATLIRRVGLAPGASVTINRYMSLYCVNLSGGSSKPSLIDGGVETTGYMYTQANPVTDVVS